MHREQKSPAWDRTEFTSPSDHEAISNRDWDRTDFTPPSDQQERSLPERDRDSISREDVSSSATSRLEPVSETGEPGESSHAFKHVPPTTKEDADKLIPDSNLEPRKEPGNGVDPVQAFFRAAGLNATQIPPEAAPVLMELFGGLFREIVQGLMDVLRARSDLKNEFRMRHTQIRTTENNPLKFSGRVDEALEHLVFNQNSGFLSPEAAFREAFQDIKDHQIAMVVGMRAAFESLLRRFDPELLESRIIKGKKIGNLLPVSRKARCWEFYEEWYAEIFAAAEDDFQRFFGDEFTRAYEDQMARLSLLRKKPGR
jgi:type VI secretion system protein